MLIVWRFFSIAQVKYQKAQGIICLDFEAGALRDNLNALLGDLNKAKPSAAKGVYIRKITVSTTMGPGLALDQGSLAI